MLKISKMAAAAARSIVRVVKPTPTGPLMRLVGTTDCKGKGTVHELEGLDPVVLCDYASLTGKDRPPYGFHPHHGLIAVTAVMDGCFTDKDNLNPPEGHHNKPGGIYMVSAGRGVCHDETTVTEGHHAAVQTIFKIPADKLKEFPVPELIRVEPADIPDLGLAGGTAKLLVGKLGNTESPAKVQALPRVVMVSIEINANAKMEVPLDDDLEHGMIWILKGKAKLGGGADWCEAGKGLWLFGKGAGMSIEAGEEGAKMLVTAGKPLNEPWVKMLGRNGFIIAEDEAEADKIMTVINETESEFSFKKMM